MSSPADLLRGNDSHFAEFADAITAAQWEQPSLCSEWTNHDVLAHLVAGYSASATAITKYMLRQRGSFDRANTQLARNLAADRSPDELIDDLSALARQPRGIGRVFPRRLLLGDHVIHELDIAYALGMPSSIPTSTLAAVLNTQVRVPNPFVPAAARARGLNFTATDVNWAHGTGQLTVSGQAAHLASVLAGRPWALRHLAGDGVAELASRVGPSRKQLAG